MNKDSLEWRAVQTAELLKRADLGDTLQGHSFTELLAATARVLEPDGQGAAPGLEVIKAPDLQRMDLPPVQFAVQGLLPQGLTVLASPPKYGKSWLMLDLCLSVADGDTFLGFRTQQSRVLYLALEDSRNRLQMRMARLLCGRPAPALFDVSTAAGTLDSGLLTQLDGYLAQHPNCRLIVVDTLQKVRGAVRGREGAYATDYRELGELKRFADGHGVALVLVHHLRKMIDDADPFNRISGTNGLLGAVDTALVMTKKRRGDEETTLSVTGRDVEDTDLILQFNTNSCRWANLGDMDAFTQAKAQLTYQSSPIRRTILGLLEQSPIGWSGTAQQLLEAGQLITHSALAPTARELSNRLRDLDAFLQEDGIEHTRQRNGTGGGKHSFRFRRNVGRKAPLQSLVPLM
ncbi:MAG: AAA family ATPase [Oscillospiraceae bacterium]|nr:AAA family ATPase [Oscillospiraceae bacterium]